MRACWTLAVAGLSASGPGREGKWAAGEPAGPARWAHAGERKGPAGEGERAGPGCWVLDWVPFLFLFLLQTHTNKFESRQI